MWQFIFKRILNGVLVLWGIITLLFFIFNFLGSPAEKMVGENTDAETRQAIEERYHLDKSLIAQYFYYLNDLSPIGSISKDDPDIEKMSYLRLFPTGKSTFLAIKSPWLGRSFASNQKVGEMITEKLPGTIILAIAAMFFACMLGIPLGTVAAVRKDKWGDRLISFVTLLGISAPSFFMAVVIIRIFSVSLGHITHLNATGYLFEEKIFSEGTIIRWENLILPAFALGIRPLSIITQLTRSSMLDVLGQDYIRTATAKGLNSRTIVWNHALKNALNPVITSISGWFASLLAGAFFIETIFDWQGIGKLTIDALSANDYPVILGAALLIGVVFVLINISVDILYTRLDPRVKLS